MSSMPSPLRKAPSRMNFLSSAETDMQHGGGLAADHLWNKLQELERAVHASNLSREKEAVQHAAELSLVCDRCARVDDSLQRLTMQVRALLDEQQAKSQQLPIMSPRSGDRRRSRLSSEEIEERLHGTKRPSLMSTSFPPELPPAPEHCDRRSPLRYMPSNQ